MLLLTRYALLKCCRLLLLLLCGACWGCARCGDKALALMCCAGALLLVLVTVQDHDDFTVL